MHNIHRPVIEVRHASLRRADDGMFKSCCPACEDGLLLLQRDPETLRLQREDRCTACGQRVVYVDLIPDVELRTWGPKG